ncbi:choice-of-anchor Q domain-containing protein [Dokdonella sp.]|uniref:choice-of-anchor Q domain-containing protein n=1 Tax=Dokdonella sp. TaxID=2291710 RepID=UPI002F42FD04
MSLPASSGTPDGVPRSNRPGSHAVLAGSHNRMRAQPIDHGRAALGGATLTVTTCDDAGPGSLREAIGVAADGDTIDLTQLTCAAITLTTGRLDASAATLTLDGPGEDVLAIDGAGASSVLHHGGTSLTINGLTIRNGADANGYGGCIFASGNLLLNASTVTGCTAGDGSNANAYGGAIDVLGNLTMIDSTISGSTATGTDRAVGGGAYAGGYLNAMLGSRISGNQAISQAGYVRGGGAYVRGAALLDLRTTISDNQAVSTTATAYGGGLQILGASAAIRNSTISGNTAHSASAWVYGGGINLGHGGDAELDRALVFYMSTVSGNTASSNCTSCYINGGGANAFGSIYSSGSTFRDNVVAVDSAASGKAAGGGLSAYAAAAIDTTITAINSTLSGNSAVGGTAGDGLGFGGGIAALTGALVLKNSTIAFNSATTSGGGIAIDVQHGANATSSMLARNDAPAAADAAKIVYGAGTAVLAGDHDLVMQAGADVALPADTIGVDPLLSPLAANGGPTATHALVACSPAIDAGSDPDGLNGDQRGAPYLRVFGTAADIGAFELQPIAERVFEDGFDPSPCG